MSDRPRRDRPGGGRRRWLRGWLRSGAPGRLRRSPGYTLAILLISTVGIGGALPVLALFRIQGLLPPRIFPAPRPAGTPEAGWSGEWGPEAVPAVRLEGEHLDALVTLLGILASVALAVACVGILLLAFSRARDRSREAAVRTALGGRRRHLVVDRLREVAVLVVAGSAAGGLGAVGGAAWLAATWPEAIDPLFRSLRSVPAGLLRSPALPALLLPAAALAVGSLGGVLSGRLYARPARRLRGGGRGTVGRPRRDVRAGLAAFQLAASLVLLATAGLLGGARLPGIPEAAPGGPGVFDPRDTVVLDLSLDPGRGEAPPLLSEGDRRAGGPDARAGGWDGLLEAVRALPGVEAGSVSTPGAWAGLGTRADVVTRCEDCTAGTMAAPFFLGAVRHHAVAAGFFDALGVDVARGRAFTASDGPGGPPVAIVNRALARRLFPRGEPLGARIRIRGRDLREGWHTVVGVADDIAPPGLGIRGEPPSAVYVPVLQHPPRRATLLVRAPGRPEVGREVATTVAGAVPGAELSNAETLATRLRRRAEPLAWLGDVLLWLAAASLLLAAAGVATAGARLVTRRRDEIALRASLGAPPWRLSLLALREVAGVVTIGLALGGWLTVGLLRGLPAILPGVNPLAPDLYGMLAAALAAAALAGAVPAAFRAAREPPRRALGTG